MKFKPNTDEFRKIAKEQATIGLKLKRMYKGMPEEIRRVEQFLMNKEISDLKSCFYVGR